MNSEDDGQRKALQERHHFGQGAPTPLELVELVVAATRSLVSATDLDREITVWLANLGYAFFAERATYGSFNQMDVRGETSRVEFRWSRSSSTGTIKACFPETEDYSRWLRQLKGGDAAYAQKDELSDPGTIRLWDGCNCQSVMFVPVTVSGRSVGWLGLEWATHYSWPPAYEPVLRAAADNAAITIERLEEQQKASSDHHEQLLVERRRAEEAEAATQSVRVREHLIQGVTEAALRLLGPGDFDLAVNAALSALGSALTPTPARIALVEDIPTPEDHDPGRWRVTHEWHAPGVWSQLGSSLESGEYPSREWWSRVRCGDPVELEATFEPDAAPNKILTTPVSGTVWRWLTVAFVDVANKRWSSAELAILQTAASCVASALQRRDFEFARVIEERRRTAEAVALSHLLEGVLNASRALLESTDFKMGVRSWLTELAHALEADRAMFRRWAHEGPDGGICIFSSKQPNSEPPISYTLNDTDLAARADAWKHGLVVWVQKEDIRDASTRALWDRLGVNTTLQVPIYGDERSKSFFCLEWSAKHQSSAIYETVLRTAADGLAAAIKRSDAVDDLLMERERSANEQSAELIKANVSMRKTLASLASSQDIDAFLSSALEELQEQSGAAEAYLFVNRVSLTNSMQLRARFVSTEVENAAEEEDPPSFEYLLDPKYHAPYEALQSGQIVWREIEQDSESPHRPDSVQRWHQSRRHRSEAVYVLKVGARALGLVVIAFLSGKQLSQSLCELLVALSQPIAMALELSRLGEIANQSARERAVFGERNRIAREVHDTLAQGFTAISLQLQAAKLAISGVDRNGFIARAALEAQDNLAESRRTIRILRGIETNSKEDDGIVVLLEHALSSRLAGGTLSWSVSGLPDGAEQPELHVTVMREVARIAQEAATNTLKHADANIFEAELTLSGECLIIRFKDDGKGFDTTVLHDGFGLTGMRERAERIGAAIEFRSQIGGPSAITLIIGLGSIGSSST